MEKQMENKIIEHTASVGDLYRRFDKGELPYPDFDARLSVLEERLAQVMRASEVDDKAYRRGYQAGYHAGMRNPSRLNPTQIKKEEIEYE